MSPLRAADLERILTHGMPRHLCATRTCARTVRAPGERCDRCSACFMCERGLFPGHLHIANPDAVAKRGAA